MRVVGGVPVLTILPTAIGCWAGPHVELTAPPFAATRIRVWRSLHSCVLYPACQLRPLSDVPITITQHVTHLLCTTSLGLPSDLCRELGPHPCLSAHVCCCCGRSRGSRCVCYNKSFRGPSVSQYGMPKRLCGNLVPWRTMVFA